MRGKGQPVHQGKGPIHRLAHGMHFHGSIFCFQPAQEVRRAMRKLSSSLIAGLVALAFAGEGLAQQTPTPPSSPAPAPSPGVSATKPAAKPGKRKAKRVRKNPRARAPKMHTKTQQ